MKKSQKTSQQSLILILQTSTSLKLFGVGIIEPLEKKEKNERPKIKSSDSNNIVHCYEYAMNAKRFKIRTKKKEKCK